MIFRLARDKPRPHLGTVDMHHQNLSTVRLSSVCRLWRAVAIGDAVLWSNIAFSTSRVSTVRCATEFLRRSQRAMIWVQIIDLQRDVFLGVAEIPSLMDEIAQQSHRIERFEAIGLSVTLAGALVYPANNLTHLTIDGHSSEKLPLIFGGQMPRLLRLSLSNPIGWSLRAFPSVTKAAIHGGGWGVSSRVLTDFLDGACSLEKLSLSGLRGLRTDHRHAAHPPIALPSLRRLKVAHCDSSSILNHLDPPPLAQISILSGNQPNDRHMLQHLPASISFRRLLHGSKSLSISLTATGDGSYLISYQNGRPSCFLQVNNEYKQLDQEWVSLTVNAITEFRPFHAIQSLTISIEQSSVPWRKWFPNLVQVVSMDICSIDIEEVMHELNRVYPNQDGPRCPSLRNISLERKGCGPALDSTVLKSCLLARSQAGHPIRWLRIRTWDWREIDRTDLGWKALIASQGMLLCF